MANLTVLVLVTLLFGATCAPLVHSLIETAPTLVDVTIDNALRHTLNTTVFGSPLGGTRYVLIPPCETGTLGVALLAAFPSPVKIIFRVLDVEYSPDSADVLGNTIRRGAAGTGRNRIKVESPCEKGQEYLESLRLTFSVFIPGIGVEYNSICGLPVPS